MKLFSQVVAGSLVGKEEINYEKAKKLTSDAKFEEEEIKATVSALTYILTSAAKYGVSEVTLANELQQIGFPREHGTALCRVYSDHAAALSAQLCRTSLRTSKLVDAKTQPRGDNHVEVTLTYWSGETDSQHTTSFTASNTQLALLLHDMKLCSEKLEKLENEI